MLHNTWRKYREMDCGQSQSEAINQRNQTPIVWKWLWFKSQINMSRPPHNPDGIYVKGNVPLMKHEWVCLRVIWADWHPHAIIGWCLWTLCIEAAGKKNSHKLRRNKGNTNRSSVSAEEYSTIHMTERHFFGLYVAFQRHFLFTMPLKFARI